MSNYEQLTRIDPEISGVIKDEVNRQNSKIELIASENFTSQAVIEALGTPLTNKYAEGYPGKRWYGGCEFVDVAESLAIERAKKLFGADHANLQPHSGAQANMAVFYAALDLGDKFMGMDLSHGGHLTHGMQVNFSGKYFNAVSYGVNKDTFLIDYDELEKKAKIERPRLIIAGASAYPRMIDFKRFREIADEVGALLMVDMAHIAGLVAAGLHPSPVPYAHFVTTTTHKTLRGPRGGMILCKEEYAKAIDSAIFPGLQGGPLMNVIAAKAVCLLEASKPDFVEYQKRVLKNAQALAAALKSKGYTIVSGGTDNHLMLVDLTNKNITGKEASAMLDEVNITVNKNTIPFETKSAFVTSGIRLGTPAMTTRGCNESDMADIAEMIDLTLTSFESNKDEVKKRVKLLCDRLPIYR